MSSFETKVIIFSVIFAIIIILYCKKSLGMPYPWESHPPEKFSTKKEAGNIYKNTKAMFKGGNASYESYKAAVPNADIVDYYNIKSLHIGGKLSPDNIESVLV